MIISTPEFALEIMDELYTILTRMLTSGVQHPVSGNNTFLGHAMLVSFDVERQQITVSSAGSHQWPYADDPRQSFDDRSIS